MKLELDNDEALTKWLTSPVPAIFQKRDLRRFESEILAADLTGCALFGCLLTDNIARAAVRAHCVILPPVTDVPFDVYTASLYTPAELYDGYDPKVPSSYEQCFDRKIFLSCMDPIKKEPLPASADLLLYRRMHDATIAEALEDITSIKPERFVAIMGGHDRARTEPIFTQVAGMALMLSKAGYVVVTGGGPGLMEAANLGAYAAGFRDADEKLKTALKALLAVPGFGNIQEWLCTAFLAWRDMGTPDYAERAMNLGVPTWFYGHEPPNVFATHIAKYFENSVREEGLLALAMGGVVFAEGNAGTIQEIFQDTTQNYYRTYAKKKSPMVLFGSQYWISSGMCFNDPADKRKPIYPLLHKLATEKAFDDYLLVTDDAGLILQFIKSHPPA